MTDKPRRTEPSPGARELLAHHDRLDLAEMVVALHKLEADARAERDAARRMLNPDDLRLVDEMADTVEQHMGRAARAEAERDGAYRERAHLLALLASLHSSVIAPAPDVDEPGWQILYLRIGGKQASWHIAPRDAELLAHVEHVGPDDSRAQWDGHTTEEKYAHLGQHAAQLYAEARGLVETPSRPLTQDEQAALATATGIPVGTRVTQAVVDEAVRQMDAGPHTGLVVQPYREHGQEKWVFRCWGTDDGCDGLLSLDHYSQQSAERARDRHVADEHKEA